MGQRTAAKNESAILAGVRSLGYSEVARLLDCAESTVSELSGPDKYKFNFRSVAALLARMGLKIVGADQMCYDPKKIEFVFWAAQQYMAQLDPKQLEIDAEKLPPPPGDSE